MIGFNPLQSLFNRTCPSLDNVDLLAAWVSEEPALLSEDDFNWESRRRIELGSVV